MARSKSKNILIPTVTFEATIEGTSPLILQKFETTHEKITGFDCSAKLQSEFLTNTYWLSARPISFQEFENSPTSFPTGIPAVFIRNSLVTACQELQIKPRKFRIPPLQGALIPIQGICHLRVDRVKIGDDYSLRARPCYNSWRINFSLEIDASLRLGTDEIHELLSVTGREIGLGAWRPEKGGVFGLFKPVDVKKIENKEA